MELKFRQPENTLHIIILNHICKPMLSFVVIVVYFIIRKYLEQIYNFI